MVNAIAIGIYREKECGKIYASNSCIWHCVNWMGWKKGRPRERSGDCTKSGWWMQYLCWVDVKHTVLYFRVWEETGRGWLWPGRHKSMQHLNFARIRCFDNWGQHLARNESDHHFPSEECSDHPWWCHEHVQGVRVHGAEHCQWGVSADGPVQ